MVRRDDRYRIVLAVGAVVLPVMGVLHRIHLSDAVDSMGVRLLTGGAALAVLLASYRSERVRGHLRGACVALLWWVQGWFAFLSVLNGMNHDRAFSMILITAVAPALFHTAREAVSFAVFTLVCVAGVYGLGAEDSFPAGVLVVTVSTLLAIVGSITVSRARLEGELARAHDDLEQRVHQRTAELLQQVEQRRRAESAARAASAAKSAFLANMSHELRTPLTAIVGYTELVLEETSDFQEELGRVLGSSRHLLGIVDDVLELARLEAGRVEVVPGDTDLEALVARALDEVRLVAEAGGTGLLSRVEVARWWTDGARVEQILGNLLSNAVRFTSGGQIEVSATAEGACLVLRVRDTGCGIEAEKLPTLFHRFTQGDESATRRHGGTGLGLALSRELAGLLGGSVTVQSVVGEGSTFSVRLPPGAPS